MLEENKKKNKEIYNKKVINVDIAVGDKVLLKNETGHTYIRSKLFRNLYSRKNRR